ncbi:MAG: hypothetical protein II643_05905 [Oscillospiraceae bacterium]|nr:hypothetical protein [Oscillospiraceae bacterium]
MACPRCGSSLFDGSVPCPQCGYVNGAPAEHTVYTLPDQPAAGDSAGHDTDALSGYLSYTSGSGPVRSSGSNSADPYTASGDDTVRSGSSDREWISYASVICGALSAYSSPMILPGILLGISAVILGIFGRSSFRKKLAVIGIIAGLIGLLLSVLVVLFYIGVFKLVYDFLFGGFGFRMFGGW